ncbi:MAG: histidine kinase, partial [Saprospiraceae bacterium]
YEYDSDHNILFAVKDSFSGYQQIEGKRNYFCSRDGTMWFADGIGRICKWLPYQSTIVFKDTLVQSHVKAGQVRIFEFNRQFMLIATVEEYFLLDKETGKTRPLLLREDQEKVLQPQSVNSCMETRSGIVVLGLKQGQIIMINPLLQNFSYRKIIYQESLPGANLSDVEDDIEFHTRYLSVTGDSVFYTEDLISGQIISHDKTPGPGTSNMWLLDQTGRLWLTNGSMVLEINRVNQKQIKSFQPSAPANDLYKIVETAPGKMLIGSFREGLFWFEPDKGIFEKIPEIRGWIRTQVFSLKYDRNHECAWIGTVRNGLIRYDLRLDTFVQYNYDSRNAHSLGGDWVRDIAIDSLGFVWFATDPIGLSRFDFKAHPDSAFLNFSVEDGLPSSFIGGLGVDRQGKLWMSSSNGVASLDPVNFSIQRYGREDGLLQASSSRANVYISPLNRVIVLMEKGYYYFSADHLVINDVPPEIVIHDILVFEKPFPFDFSQTSVKPIKLSYTENFLTIRFSVINLTDAENNTVQYRMDGLEDHWNIRNGISQVIYTNIPPGKYTFFIRAANNDGIWNEKETRILISIKPPFWQRTWFYILLGIMASGFIGFLYNYKLTQSIKQNKLLSEKETLKAEAEKQMAQLEMTALRAQMNPHFIFNCLNSINRFIIVNDNDTASEYLTKFSKLIRQVLDNSRGDKSLLATEIETLKLYIEMESLRFTDKFESSIDIAADLNTNEFLIQPMLIQPYVENAIWHGLMHRKTKGKIEISFSKREDSLLVEIVDNGVGREMAKSIKENQLVQRKSHGMKVTAERMSLLSKKMNVPVEAVVEDLYNEHHESIGTKVKLTLPLEPLPD